MQAPWKQDQSVICVQFVQSGDRESTPPVMAAIQTMPKISSRKPTTRATAAIYDAPPSALLISQSVSTAVAPWKAYQGMNLGLNAETFLRKTSAMMERIQAAETSQHRMPPIHHHMLRISSFRC